MLDGLATPWFDRALGRLEPRRGDRLLSLDPRLQDVVALRAAIGGEGELTVVIGDEELAEELAARELPQLRIYAHQIDGDERFGTFDAALVAPHVGPAARPERYAQLLRGNLRLGGRFVVDLPGVEMVPDLHAAWLETGWDEERLAPMSGPAEAELLDALREAGLRNVDGAMSSHILQAPSAAELVAAYAADLGLEDGDVVELAHGVVRRRQESGPLEVLVHRTQASGQR